MTTLRLWIDGGFPEQHGSCHWWLQGDDGRELQHGFSAARHWPGIRTADNAAAVPVNCELLFSADTAALVTVQLPAGRVPSGELLGYAVEEHLLSDPEDCHLVVGRKLADGRHEILAIARRRLDAVLASLRPLGLEPNRAVVATQALMPAGDEWPLLLDGERGSLTLPEGWISFDLSAADNELDWLRASDRLSTGTRLRPLLLDAGAKLPEALTNAGLTLQPAGALDATALCQRGLNLLQGDYAPRREVRFAWRTLLPVAKLAAAAAALAWLTLVGDWAWWSYRTSTARNEASAIARAALPDVSVIVSPSLQVQRALDARRHLQGELSDSDLLPLLAQLARFPGLQVDSVSYRDGRLDARVSLPAELKPAQVRAALRQEGISANIREGAHPGQLQLTLSVGDLS